MSAPRPIPTVARDRLVCIALALACFLPFVGKAFHIDDTMYMWAADHIREHPLDFYGFKVNWDGVLKPMAEENKNPPLNSYILAFISMVLGTSELALHSIYLCFPVAIALGMYALARPWSKLPLLAVCLTLFTPALLVSGTTLMTDSPLLALYIWAIVLWRDGLARETAWRLYLAAICVAFAMLTKYFGASLVPLLFVYSLIERRRAGLWLAPLALPIAVLIAYDRYYHWLYGLSPFAGAADYSAEMVSGARLVNAFVTLAFLGGGGCTIAFLLPLLRLRRLHLIGVVVSAAGLCALLIKRAVLVGLRFIDPSVAAWVWPQVAVWIFGGSVMLVLVFEDWRRHRDGTATLLALWILGSLVFAGVLNWSVTVRTILPCLPALAIIAVRRIDWLEERGFRINRPAILASLVCSLAIGLAVAQSDYALANSARTAASKYGAEAMKYSGATYFQGHWGFQYYAEKFNMQAVEFAQSSVKSGDVVICPQNSTAVSPPPPDIVQATYRGDFEGPRFVTTMSRPLGAGFYTSIWGPLPYTFGPVPPERYFAFLVK